MFKKLLNVGKGHSNEKLQQQQQHQKNLFQLNEIKSYGFSHLCCLGYSSSLSLLAVGSKFGLLRVLGNSSVEFSHQLELGNSIRQIEFIDYRNVKQPATDKDDKQKQHQKTDDDSPVVAFSTTSAKIVVLTDNGQLHLFELKTFKQQNFADNTTQTDASATSDCCQSRTNKQQPNDVQLTTPSGAPEYTKLEYAGQLNYFRYKPDEHDDRSRRVTTLEISQDNQAVFVGTESGNVYLVPLNKFEASNDDAKQQVQPPQQLTSGTRLTSEEPIAKTTNAKTTSTASADDANETTTKQDETKDDDTTLALSLNVESVPIEEVNEPFEIIKYDEHVLPQIGDDIKSKKQGAIESIKKHPSAASSGKATSATQQLLLLSYHRGLSVIYNLDSKTVEKYFYHNQVLESSCFADQKGDFFYTSHNDGSYIKWDTRNGSQATANEDFLGQLYGPYPCKPTPKIQACTGLVNDQLEELVVFSGGMPRATYDDKNPVTIVKAESDGKDSIKTVLDFTSKVLDFVVITRPRGNLGAGAKSTGGSGGGGGKKNKHKQQQQQQQQRNNPIAVALAILAEEEFVVIDLLNSESYLEFALPYLNCVHSSAITCNQHYSEISDDLYEQLLAYNKQQLRSKLSANEWPITGGKVIDAPEVKSHDILLTGHEDGSVNFWDVSALSMRHLLHLSTARFFSTGDEDLAPIDEASENNNKQEISDQDPATSTTNSTSAANNENDSSQQDSSSAWPPLKKVGRFDPFSDDTRLAIRRLSLCPQTGTLVVAGTGGQTLVFKLRDEPSELDSLQADDITLVNDQRFTWKGKERLAVRPGSLKQEPGYQLVSYVQLDPPASATALDLRSDWNLYALGTSYGFFLYDYANKHSVVSKCTLNVQDFAIVSGDAAGTGAMSRKKSFRKSLRESFRRLRRGRSQRGNQQQAAVTGRAAAVAGDSTTATTTASTTTALKPAFSRVTTGVRALNAPSMADSASHNTPLPRNVYSQERQVEHKVELSSIIRCITLTSAVITSHASFKPTLWVGTNSGQVLVYAIELASEQRSAVLVNSEVAATSPAKTAVEQEEVDDSEPVTTARLAKEIQLKHKAPIIAIFTTPDAPAAHQLQAVDTSNTALDNSIKSTPEKQASELLTNVGDKSGTSEQKSQDQPEAAVEADRPQTPAVVLTQDSAKLPPPRSAKDKDSLQARVLICSEEQFKVFNLPNLKPFCKFKLTANEGLRAKKISITQLLKPVSNNKLQQQQSTAAATTAALSASRSLQSFATQTSRPASPIPPADGVDEQANSAGKQENNNNNLAALNNNHTTSNNSSSKQDSKELMNAKFGAKTSAVGGGSVTHTDKDLLADGQQHTVEGNLFEPYMVCMSNQGDCAIYSVPDLKRQASIQVCKREDVNGITSTMLTNYGEGYYLKSSSNFLRFSISTQRVLRVLSVV